MANSNGIFRFNGRRFVVTGAARGIGYAIARLVAASGAAVAILDLEGANPEQAASGLRDELDNAEILSEICDVSSYDQIAAARRAVEARWGAHADTLVNNAGIAYNAPAEEMSVEEWDRMLQINLSGVFYCSQLFGAPMIQAGSGCIVSIASMSGLIVNRPQPQVAYNVSKAGVIMLTKSLAAEWAPHGVRTLCLLVTPAGRAVDPERISRYPDLGKSDDPGALRGGCSDELDPLRNRRVPVEEHR